MSVEIVQFKAECVNDLRSLGINPPARVKVAVSNSSASKAIAPSDTCRVSGFSEFFSNIKSLFNREIAILGVVSGFFRSLSDWMEPAHDKESGSETLQAQSGACIKESVKEEVQDSTADVHDNSQVKASAQSVEEMEQSNSADGKGNEEFSKTKQQLGEAADDAEHAQRNIDNPTADNKVDNSSKEWEKNTFFDDTRDEHIAESLAKYSKYFEPEYMQHWMYV
jgi:hypothetical protein